MAERSEKDIAKEIDGGMTEKELEALLSKESKEFDKVPEILFHG